MADAVAGTGCGLALVLGGGGPVGLSWMTGLMVGLRAAGIDAAAADRFVGTSAGAVVGAVLAAGDDPARILTARPADSAAYQVDWELVASIFAVLAEPGDPVQARRRAGQLALTAETGAPHEHVARMTALVGATAWPQRELLITAVDVGTGELRVWTRSGAASLGQALASSTAVPGVFAPIPVAGHAYFDGGTRSPVNADLAAGAQVVVIVEPLAHLFARIPSDRDLGAATVISVVPDAESVAAFGPDVFDPAALAPAYAAGVRQGPAAAEQLRGVWPTR
ncbi:patatin-like phospholipase family protein [Nocardia terpenica]|uniref:patatin-like phospholipase family protein n=1 Tax=Nocardia terpenica TaxID=455432 RepID=UPI001892EE36|nr:patatin-like phospholipase family protein [Nocardia terpenica]MBF6061365.1 patatin-like phospholipase family protein [Nocardia terpenica]MBF6105406.1 patatin-like phospholipase family protein [Nocardia terpenica]MBF6113124.1 patatin-like phospholipase family protein [Nocardia terpenica]MBF6119254.1 patatin-like phospholipase family protein [Nocardia terpenica]MBF6152902.1 patatin-like phospholipase family protein [Nocardia terpenica]